MSAGVLLPQNNAYKDNSFSVAELHSFVVDFFGFSLSNKGNLTKWLISC